MSEVLNHPAVTLTLFAIGMLAMIVPALVLAFFTRDSRSSTVG